jgi:hypothetical protein
MSGLAKLKGREALEIRSEALKRELHF